ncbi:MAG: MCE family protein [Crocinitomicaceae bacterium]|nr:MCE family protein [Crocinitomicaceae bacterium]
MKISKELVTGFITIAAIALLITGVNFLKGHSFFGGDQIYYAYFPNSGGVTPATSVYINGVDVGKVLEVTNRPNSKDTSKMVKIKFNIQDDALKLSKGTVIEAGGIDMFNKGLTIRMNTDPLAGYYSSGATLNGVITVDITSQIKAYADPITQKLQGVMVSVDKMVEGVSSFWDTTATSELEASMKEIQIAIRKFGNAANEIEGLLMDERLRLSRIMGNVEAITVNLKKSNDSVRAIVGNVKRITDDLVTADFKSVIGNAKTTLAEINKVLESANKGEGTLGKLLSDESLYNGLVKTNEELQNLVNDLQVHPERYIHFSVFGAKTKGVPLTNIEEQKLRKVLDSIAYP